ncbi:MAG: YfiR family protein [Planctomycetes bacterium]|nr:YfiR family protein [Planctomycetota bacterium]
MLQDPIVQLESSSRGPRRSKARARRSMLYGRMARILSALLLFCAITDNGQAQAPTVVDPGYEYNVKAAYLYSFGRYVKWHAQALARHHNEFVIGVLGENQFDGALEKIAEAKQIQQRPIRIRYWNSFDEYEPCHILFVTNTIDFEQQLEVIRKLATDGVLLVGETEGFASQGGTVNFYVTQGKVRFEVNKNSVQREALTIDARLLRLATPVDGQ